MSLKISKTNVPAYDYLSEDGVMTNPATRSVIIDKTGSPATKESSALTLYLVAVGDGGVNLGSYTGLAFDIGVPFAQNHGDPTLAASPLNLTAMFWSWQAGYKFIKIDMATSGQPLPPPMKMGLAPGDMAAGDMAKADDASKMDMSGPMGWEIHLGSTGCASDSQTTSPKVLCANPNRMAIRLDGFMPGMEGMDKVVLDPAPVLAAANVDVNAKDTMPGCMAFPGDADCPPVMAALGLSYEGAAPGAQAFATLH